MSTCCVTAVESKSLEEAEKLRSCFLTSGLRRVMVARVMSVLSKYIWISSVYCEAPTEREEGRKQASQAVRFG